MAELRLDIQPERVTLDALIEYEDHQTSQDGRDFRFMRDFLARFVVNGDGEAVDLDEARALVGKMTLAQINETMQHLGDAMQAQQAGAVSGEAKGGSSQ